MILEQLTWRYIITASRHIRKLHSYIEEGLDLSDLETSVVTFNEQDKLYHLPDPRHVYSRTKNKRVTLSFTDLYNLRGKFCPECGGDFSFSNRKLSVWVKSIKLLKEVEAFKVDSTTSFEDYQKMISNTWQALNKVDEIYSLERWAKTFNLLVDPQSIEDKVLLNLSRPLIRERARTSLSKRLDLPGLKLESVKARSQEWVEATLKDYENYNAWVLLDVTGTVSYYQTAAGLDLGMKTFDNIFKIYENIYLLPALSIPWVSEYFPSKNSTIFEGEVNAEHVEAFKVLFSPGEGAYGQPAAALKAARAL